MNVNGFDKSNRTEELIAASLSIGRFPHAAILEGGSAEERIALAKKIALTLLCENDENVPCGVCNHCRKTSLDVHPDVLIKKPRKKDGSKNETYYVDYIREIRDEAYIIPNESDLKIFILEEAHIMNEQAQNAFLKILEEPPEFSVFLLLTPTKSVYLTTILSRATVYSLGGDARESKESVDREKAAAAAESIADSLAAGSHFDIVVAAGVFDKDQKLLAAALPIMSDIFMKALRIKYNAEEESEFPETCRALADKLSKRTLLKLIDDVNVISDAIKQNANNNLTIARLCTLFKSASLEQE